MKLARTILRVALLVGAASACVLPQRAPTRRPASEPTAAVPAAAPRRTLRRAEGAIEVLLTQPSGAGTVRLEDPVLGAVEFELHERRVRARGEEREEWLVGPGGGTGTLAVAGRSYPGAVRIRAGRSGGLEVRARVDLEDYVAGVVAAELSAWSAPPALLEAQAIAARSYAVAQLDERGRSSPAPYLFDDTRDMVYRGEPAGGPAVAARVRAAVERTRGLVLWEDERVLDARFHAACGGRTAAGRDVFGACDFECLRAVDCAPCRTDPPAEWSTTATRAELDALCAAAGVRAGIVRLRPGRIDPGGRWIELSVEGADGTATLPFEALRHLLGPERVASAVVLGTWPRPGEEIPGGLALRGRGSGHGVGLCQRGARGYAERGWSAERILAHYYGGARLADGRRAAARTAGVGR